MSRAPQQLLDLAFPAVPPAVVPARVRELSPPDAGSAPAARELWAAVQRGASSQHAAEEAPETSRALAALVRQAQSFTPRVALESADAVLLELAGSLRLFGGLPPLLQALRQAFPRPLQLALAPTPLAAVLLARAGRNCCITTHARLAGRLSGVPLRHLHWSDEELARLAGMGVATLGELLRLPRAGLARRIGPERLWQLDRLTGLRSDPRAELVPAARFSEKVDAGHETADRERLLAALAPTLARLEEFLRERQRGVLALRVTLHCRRAAPVHCLVRCVVPEYRAARFAALLAARLEAVQLPGAVGSMVLTAGRQRRFVAASGALWSPGEHGGDAAAAAAPEFLQTLTVRLGEGAVYGLATVDEHRPERQYRAVPPLCGATLRSAASAAAAPADSARHRTAARPLGLLPEPLPLDAERDAAGQVQCLRHGAHALHLLTGPERIESGWWDGAGVARDYYVARGDDGAQWWIFRDGATRRWFVHGCFA